MTPRIARFAACLGVLAISAATATSAAARPPSEPAVNVSASQLRSAVQCKGDLTHARKDPVLLIPGTFAWGEINWGWNYQKLLPTLGHPACTVSFPADGAGDIQPATEYAVAAIRMMERKSARKIVVMGHSQGGLEARWALRWWPDLRADVAQVITLAAPNGGAEYTNLHCGAPRMCSASLYQMRSSSKFLGVLNHGHTLTWNIPWTTISTTADTVFVLPPQATLRGATNLKVQQLCPADQSDHVGLAYDGPTSAIVLYALAHGGRVNLSRINSSACASKLMPDVLQSDVNAVLNQYLGILAKDLGPKGPHAEGEPPLACYVTGSCPTHRRTGGRR